MHKGIRSCDLDNSELLWGLEIPSTGESSKGPTASPVWWLCAGGSWLLHLSSADPLCPPHGHRVPQLGTSLQAPQGPEEQETKLQPHSTCLGQGLPKALKKEKVASILGGHRPRFNSTFLRVALVQLCPWQMGVSCIVTLHEWRIAVLCLQPAQSLNSTWPRCPQRGQAQAHKSEVSPYPWGT